MPGAIGTDRLTGADSRIKIKRQRAAKTTGKNKPRMCDQTAAELRSHGAARPPSVLTAPVYLHSPRDSPHLHPERSRTCARTCALMYGKAAVM
ncbi:hypothetical protein F2P81_014599 [Scophthalmus maximus]|uniref:Uncharacterized protein n=1 Tax=Scophthalmus maximus TaxID=52904 RepID=A0A6A4SIG5_SCOMX|nr:hypothetical protein F2P81_014599 [Scophthalmus maximus]